MPVTGAVSNIDIHEPQSYTVPRTVGEVHIHSIVQSMATAWNVPALAVIKTPFSSLGLDTITVGSDVVFFAIFGYLSHTWRWPWLKVLYDTCTHAYVGTQPLTWAW